MLAIAITPRDLAVVGLAAGVGYVVGLLFRRTFPKSNLPGPGAWTIVGGLLGVWLAFVGGTPGVGVIKTAEELERTLVREATPVVVYLYADWCPPCRKLAPVVEDLQAEWAGRVRFFKVNVDESPDLAYQLGVRGIPTLVYFRDGGEVNRTTGFLSKQQLSGQLEALCR